MQYKYLLSSKKIHIYNRDNIETLSLNQPKGEQLRYIPEMLLVEIVYRYSLVENGSFFHFVRIMSKI